MTTDAKNINGLTYNNAGHYENEEYVFFWDGVFSNWANTPFIYDTGTEYGTINFTCAEQAMMFHKAYLFNDHDSIIKILSTPNPREQKALGRKVKDFDKAQWESVCIDLITNVLVAKFDSTPTLGNILISSYPKIISEASPSDRVWGVGMGVEHPDLLNESKWNGKNFLGICLMNARKILRDRYMYDDITER